MKATLPDGSVMEFPEGTSTAAIAEAIKKAKAKSKPKQTAKPKSQPKQTPKPEPKPEINVSVTPEIKLELKKEKGADDGSKLLAIKLDEISKANLNMLAELKKQIGEITLSMPEHPDSWMIDREYDEKGLPMRTTLTPVYNKKTLN